MADILYLHSNETILVRLTTNSNFIAAIMQEQMAFHAIAQSTLGGQF